MFKSRINFDEIWLLSAILIPVAGIVMTKIVSPLLNILNENSNDLNSRLLVPTSVQSTAYYVSHPNKFHP